MAQPKQRTKMKLKRGDTVRIIAGKDKGKEGEIIEVHASSNRVTVRDANLIKKTRRPTEQDRRGGFDEREAPIHASNVMIIDPQMGEPTRIGYTFTEGRKVRIAKTSGAELD